MLQDFLQKRRASSIGEQCKVPDDVRDEGGNYVAWVDENSPIRFQIIEDVLGDSSDTKASILSRDPVTLQRGSNPETIPSDQVTVKDWLRRLKAEEAAYITSRNDMLRSAFFIRREDNEAFPNPAEGLVLN